MKRTIALLILIAFMVPLMVSHLQAQDTTPARPGAQSVPVMGFEPASRAPFDTLQRARNPYGVNQVRIEQRVVIRVGPAAPAARTQMLADLPRRSLRTRYEEVEHDNCIEAERVIGVQPTTDNRLLFFTDEEQILAARLAEGCVARAFYAGFYIERSEDGRLCVARDRLQSRAGASCEVADFTRLVAVAN